MQLEFQDRGLGMAVINSIRRHGRVGVLFLHKVAPVRLVLDGWRRVIRTAVRVHGRVKAVVYGVDQAHACCEVLDNESAAEPHAAILVESIANARLLVDDRDLDRQLLSNSTRGEMAVLTWPTNEWLMFTLLRLRSLVLLIAMAVWTVAAPRR